MDDKSPLDADFSTPPTTPMPAHAPAEADSDDGALGPSLSRKGSSKPSSLRIESARASWNPDIVLTNAASPEAAAKAKSPDSGAPRTATSGDQTTPRLPGVAPASTPAAIAALRASPRGLAASYREPAMPQSPYFVHSGLDRGVSLSDWLKSGRPAGQAQGDDSNDPSPQSEVFERDDDEDDTSAQSLTKQLAETAVGVREMSKQLGACIRDIRLARPLIST
jgi:NAD+ kinase